MRADAAPSTQALRGWQRRALVKYLAAKPRDFLAVATPGSGKTTFALRIAAELLADGTVEQVTVVVPTEHLKVQWAQAAARHRHRAGPEVLQLQRADTPSEYHGVVVTYAQVASHPDPAPGAHREPQDAGHLRRDPPRRRREELGRRHPRGVRRRHPPAGADRHAVPQRRQRRSRSSPTSAVPTGSSARRPTTPTATPTRSPTAWCGRWCSWPTPVRRAGATARARSTRPDWASR